MPRLVPMLVCAAALVAIPVQAHAKGPLVEPDDGPDPRGLTLSGTVRLVASMTLGVALATSGCGGAGDSDDPTTRETAHHAVTDHL
jgi:hypothetical protein